jgi:hypothetical protein
LPLSVVVLLPHKELCPLKSPMIMNGVGNWSGSYSAIDLTVTDPSLLLDFSWKVHDDLCRSGHFPIILESLNYTIGERPTRYNFDKADRCAEKNVKQK